jgi:hypothetical protein
MPYAYIERGIAVDFWSLVQASFVNTDLFLEAATASAGAATPRAPYRAPVRSASKRTPAHAGA